MGSSNENLGIKTIDDLPDEILEYILSLVSPYKDSDSCKLVSKRWCRTVNSVNQRLRRDLCRSVLSSNILWACLAPPNLEPTTITKRFSHAAYYCDNIMYVFGGCTSRCTTFNDLWTLDLSSRIWLRPCTTGSYPSPKACATLCYYNKNLLLFGGWTHRPSHLIEPTLKLFNELHIYNITSNKWTVIHSTTSPPPMAGHSATIHGNLMVVFGGLHRAHSVFCRSSNHVWCYNLDTGCWSQPETSDPKPRVRYGQSQIYLDEENILIMGGCEGPNAILDDVWLLTITDSVWIWKKIKVLNSQWTAPHLWCHPACRVGNAVVVFSRGAPQSVSHYSCSTVQIDFPFVDDSIPPEVVARVASQGSLPYIKDTNVNGQRGSLGKSNSSSVEPSPSSSRSNEEAAPSEETTNDKCKYIYRVSETLCSSHNCRMNNDIQMAAFRDDLTCPRFFRNRMKQLEMLRRLEEKYKNSKRKESKRKLSNDEDPGPSGGINIENRMNMYVMDISEVLTENACVSWKPPRCNSNAPREKMLYSLILGRGELVIFGGVQNNPSFAFPFTGNNCISDVSNETHIVAAPHNVV